MPTGRRGQAAPPTKPGGKAAEASGTATKPGREAAEASGTATKPGREAAEASGTATKPGREAAEASGTATKPSGEAAESAGAATAGPPRGIRGMRGLPWRVRVARRLGRELPPARCTVGRVPRLEVPGAEGVTLLTDHYVPLVAQGRGPAAKATASSWPRARPRS